MPHITDYPAPDDFTLWPIVALITFAVVASVLVIVFAWGKRT